MNFSYTGLGFTYELVTIFKVNSLSLSLIILFSWNFYIPSWVARKKIAGKILFKHTSKSGTVSFQLASLCLHMFLVARDTSLWDYSRKLPTPAPVRRVGSFCSLGDARHECTSLRQPTATWFVETPNLQEFCGTLHTYLVKWFSQGLSDRSIDTNFK